VTETDLLQRIARLSPERLSLLVKKNRAALPAAGAPAIVPRPDASHVPLSFQQRGFWFVNQLESGSPLYNMHAAFAVSGFLRRSVLAASLAEMARRHEILRARFPAEDGAPVQRIDGPSEIALPLVDLGGLPERLRTEEGERLVRQEARRPFDIARAPLLRLLQVRQDDDEHLIAVAFHHIVSDGWSIGVFIREIVTLYEAFAQGLPSPLPDQPIQYADYAVWQQRALAEEVLAGQISYWREVLRGAPELLELPSDRPRPAARSPRGGEVEISLGFAPGAALRRLATDESATLYMVLLAGFQAFLARLSGRDDVIVGSPMAGRDLVETESVIGPFVNTVVRRTRWTGDPSFRRLLAEVRREILAAAPHAGLPFDRLVEALRQERSTSFSPLFQVCLVLHNEPMPEIDLPELALRPISVHSGTAKFDLTLALRETADRLAGTLEYAADLYDRTTARRLVGQLGTLLAAAATEPDRRLSYLPLLTAAERHQLTAEWTDTRCPYPRERGIHQLFAEQAARTPEATALVFLGQRLSYRELDEKADRVARRLAALGVSTESRVGLFSERSFDMVIGILGILKAGAAYVPLDIQYPCERLEWMLVDAGIAAVLVQERLLVRLPGGPWSALRLDEMAQETGEEVGALANRWAGPDSAAYVMYTSGSTGRPKGVLVTHRNVVRLVKGTGFARFDEKQVFLQLAPVAFDAATLEIWGPLLNGGTLVMFHPAEPLFGELGRTIRREGVTTLWLTAGLFHQVVDEMLEDLAGIEQLLMGGDVLSPAHVRRALAKLSGCLLINGYGPTENTTFTCCHSIVDRPAGAVPIGRPIANTWIHVVDSALEPVPVGVSGELLAGGDGLGRGYSGSPDLTAVRFIPDPFSVEPGARLYRTGDLVRRAWDGTVEFLGRMDDQVKIRGFRVEPGEVEVALERHPGVAACVVAMRGGADDKRLVAYVVPTAGLEPASTTAAELRAFLEETLPAPMIPSAFVTLDSLPLTVNGKIDRTALPSSESGEGRTEAVVAPRSPVEKRIGGIWCEVLAIDRLSVEDSFFALGGHSLQMMKIASRLRDAFGVELPLRALYESTTIAALAARVEQEIGAPGALQGALLGSLPRPALIPLSGAQRRLWFLDQLDPGRPTYNVPLGLRLQGPLDVAALAAALSRIVERHEVLRTSFPSLRGEPFQAIAAPAPPPLPLVDLAGLPEMRRRAEAERLATAEARAPFELATGAVLRLRLLLLAPDEHDLLVVFHHIAADGWSVRVFVKELETLYTAGCQGRAALLPNLPVQYADFALWHNEWLSGEEVGRQLDWWREHLSGVAPLDLATDRPRPPVQRQRGAFRSRALSGDVAAELRALASQQGATLFATLLASVEAVLDRSTGQRDLAIGSPLTNRGRSELEGLIGFFANTIVLRGDLSGDPPFRRLLAAAQEEVVAAQEHQDAPFERLVEVLQPDRDLGRSPLFQVMLTVENGWDEARLAGLDSALRVLDAGASKLDLGFTFFELEGARVAINYDTDLFEAPTIDRLLDHWLTLLAGAAAAPETPLSYLPLLPEAARHQLRVEWNAHDVGEPADDSIHGLIEAQVRRAPGEVAVVWGDVELSYAELDRQAGCLARRLVDLGAGPEVRIGVLLRRSAAMVVALLAALKSGAAYLPLDPAYPARRLELMLEDASPAVVVTEEPLLPLLPPGPFQTVCLDAFDPGPGRGTGVRVEPENLAYLIYTSGSTGRPKGVAISHRSATAILRWARQSFPPEALAGVLAGTSICFDLSVFELFAPLAWGGCVFLVENTLALTSLPRAGDVTLINTVPSVMTELVRLDVIPPSVAIVNLAGEPLHRALVEEIYRRSNVEQVLNLYGPSEDTVYSTWARMERGSPGAPPIGRPLAGTRAYVLDRDLCLVPPGQPGELCLAGAGLARGYFGRPELTAERFVPDPLSSGGGRLYRTGDRARFRPDGQLELLGRFDHQVKIRGFRIEPGEIETALRAHPEVREARVGLRESAGLGKRLVAWVVPDLLPGGGSEPPERLASELRLFLARSLPAPMVPAAFVLLDRLPLSPNGKVDLRALPDPDLRMPRSGAPERPRNDLERTIAGVWSEILEREEIGIQDNFFELGGHSLLAVRVTSHLQEALERKIRVLEIFEHPTVASLAAALSTGTEGTDLAPSRSRAAARRDSLRKREAQRRITVPDEERLHNE
jgi:amino acid adenylation domain-containing protein